MEVFQTGERTRRKADPCNVSKAMRKATNPDGTYIFDTSGYFTSQQVAIFSHALLPKEMSELNLTIVKITSMDRWR